MVPEATILFWAKQLIEAIGYLHKNNIVHRDIKMGNILIDKYFNIILCDFGLCKIIVPGHKVREWCGTPMTMAPEVILRKLYRLMPDWWSVGIVIYQLMNKKNPFKYKK